MRYPRRPAFAPGARARLTPAASRARWSVTLPTAIGTRSRTSHRSRT